MSKCIVCECASILTYEPPKERPPLKCPNCGRDTRHYASMKEDDPRVRMLVEKYKTRLGDTEAAAGVADSGVTQPAAGVADSGVTQAAAGVADSGVTQPAAGMEGSSIRQPAAGVASYGITQSADDMPGSGGKQQEGKPQYCLVSKDGEVQIKIPDGGGVIGRTAVGGEELAHNGRISREHVKLTPAKRALGVMAEDLSANGTFVDGRRLTKNDREFVVIGSVIKMGGEEFVLEMVEPKQGCGTGTVSL
ncbi:MAG: FHA domain-containing protein [Lachnospiraceae bacterium]|nr:FHA domain-containing protein [Lachnospiraceae bacterium]